MVLIPTRLLRLEFAAMPISFGEFKVGDGLRTAIHLRDAFADHH